LALIAGQSEPLFSLARSVRLSFLFNISLIDTKCLVVIKKFWCYNYWWEVEVASYFYGDS